MALQLHPTKITIDSPARRQSRNVTAQSTAFLPSVELYYGDIMAKGAINNEDILVISSNPIDTLIGSNNISQWAKNSQNNAKWFDLNPSLHVATYSAPKSLPFADVMYWDPAFGPLTTAQAAPYKTDDIFRGAQAMWGHIPKSIVIPLHIGDNGFCTSTIMLQSILHSALKLGGWMKYIPTSIKIVLDKKDQHAISAFDTIAQNYDTLRGAPNRSPGQSNPPTGFPTANGKPYSFFMTESNDWMSTMFPDVKDINPITEFQAFAINIYTSSFFTPMQSVLRRQLITNAIAPLKGSTALPTYHNTGFTDLGNPDYQALIPLLATVGAGLTNIPAYNGTTFRGTGDGSYLNKYQAGNSVRIISYLSSADEFAGAGLPWPVNRFRDERGKKMVPPSHNITGAPWNNSNHIRTQSITARDISPYSMHQYEREHLYDYEFLEYFTSNEPGGHPSMNNKTITGNFTSVEVSESIYPLLK